MSIASRRSRPLCLAALALGACATDPHNVSREVGAGSGEPSELAAFGQDLGASTSAPVPARDLSLALDQWLTVSGNFEVSHRETQFFEREHDATYFLGDVRVEGWLPPFRSAFSWGPYVRGAIIDSTSRDAFENEWLAAPGIGLQVYPFSGETFRSPDSTLGQVLGPTRLFAEYNRTSFWGDENGWRPTHQVRAGLEYWKAIDSNRTTKPLWAEIYTSLTYQTANEFDAHYDSVIFGNNVRAGVRVPDAGLLSQFTPYVLADSLLTTNHDYYYENRFQLGAGLRFAPDLRFFPRELNWLNRLVVFVEYVDTVSSYRASIPSSTPRHDVRFGIEFSFGDYWK